LASGHRKGKGKKGIQKKKKKKKDSRKKTRGLPLRIKRDEKYSKNNIRKSTRKVIPS